MQTYNEKNDAKWSVANIQYLFDISLRIFPANVNRMVATEEESVSQLTDVFT